MCGSRLITTGNALINDNDAERFHRLFSLALQSSPEHFRSVEKFIPAGSRRGDAEINFKSA